MCSSKLGEALKFDHLNMAEAYFGPSLEVCKTFSDSENVLKYICCPPVGPWPVNDQWEALCSQHPETGFCAAALLHSKVTIWRP